MHTSQNYNNFVLQEYEKKKKQLKWNCDSFIIDFTGFVHRVADSFFLRKFPKGGNFPHTKEGNRRDTDSSRFVRFGQKVNEKLFFPQIDVDETELCSITGQLNRAMQIELFHDAVAMVFNGFAADEEFFRNLLC
jgi:hypothetical protein